MKQRVAIARGMAMEPDILLMDEPFAALDALTRRTCQDELLQLWDETQFTVLFVTHSIAEAIKIGNRILLLSPHPGRVTAEIERRRPRCPLPTAARRGSKGKSTICFSRPITRRHTDVTAQSIVMRDSKVDSRTSSSAAEVARELGFLEKAWNLGFVRKAADHHLLGSSLADLCDIARQSAVVSHLRRHCQGVNRAYSRWHLAASGLDVDQNPPDGL